MPKKRSADITALEFYQKNSLQAVSLLFRNPKLFLPDFFLILITLLIATVFLSFNNLLLPLFSPARLTLLRDQLTLITTHLPSLTRLIFSFLALLFVNIVFGINILALRYEYMKELVLKKKTTLLNAYHHSRAYFISLVSIKLVLTIIYFILILIFHYFFTSASSFYFYLLIPAILVVIVLRIAFFFVMQDLFVNKTGVRALVQSMHYFRTTPKKTLITLLIVSSVDFLITILFSLFPASWGHLALRLEALHLTTVAILLFLILRAGSSILITLWSETFKFLVYTEKT